VENQNQYPVEVLGSKLSVATSGGLTFQSGATGAAAYQHSIGRHGTLGRNRATQQMAVPVYKVPSTSSSSEQVSIDVSFGRVRHNPAKRCRLPPQRRRFTSTATSRSGDERRWP
jgi:hypothetical protein